jgi:hypothetical protein
MSNFIVVVAHCSDTTPNHGRFEVRFPDGRPSVYFDWSAQAGPVGNMGHDQARDAANTFAQTQALRTKYRAAPVPNSDRLRLGDRVQLSDLGKSRFPRAGINLGSVVSIPRRGGRSIQVLFDGNAHPTKVHFAYVEQFDGKS